MRPQSAMYELAKASALENGPLILDKDEQTVTKKINEFGNYVIGYGLTLAQLAAIYTDCGYNIERKTWEKHIKSWEFSGKAMKWPNAPYIFFKKTGRLPELNAISSLGPGKIEVIA